MDVRDLVNIVTSRWYVVVPLFLIVLVGAALLTLSQDERYRSTTSYVVRPTISESTDLLGALGVVSRQTEIASTYVQIASSRRIRDAADAASGLSEAQLDDVAVAPRLVAGTNVLEITAEAGDPEVARAYAAAVGEATADFVTGSYGEVFELSLLDEPVARRRPSSPNVPFNLLLGFGAALVLAVGAAFVLEIVAASRRRAMADANTDETGALSDAYLANVIGEEMKRARAAKVALSVGLIDADGCGYYSGLSPASRSDALRRLVAVLGEHLSDVERIGRVGPTAFAIVMPGIDSSEALKRMSFLSARGRVATQETAQDGAPVYLSPVTALVTYLDADVDVTGLLLIGNDALVRARETHDAICAGRPVPEQPVARPRQPHERIWSHPPDLSRLASAPQSAI